MKLVPAEPTAPSAWTCPMHPEVIEHANQAPARRAG